MSRADRILVLWSLLSPYVMVYEALVSAPLYGFHYTGYLYAFNHDSSDIPFTVPYFDIVSWSILSGTSGGRFAILFAAFPNLLCLLVLMTTTHRSHGEIPAAPVLF
jgi:hypothetical protein